MSELAIIRPAEPRDLEAVNALLGQVLAVHHASRPDLFRPVGKKYTDEEHQESGLHIGTALFDYVKAFAKKKGCHNITLHVWEGNPGAE